jgi:hypothetical protein
MLEVRQFVIIGTLSWAMQSIRLRPRDLSEGELDEVLDRFGVG